MRRFFTEEKNIIENIAYLYEDAGHITRVLRMQKGDEILIFDGTGFEYKAVLSELLPDVVKAKIISKEFSAQEPKVKVTIYQGIPKSDKMQSIIQKSVELGVHSIVPVSMDRCVSKIEAGKKELEKIKRFNKISVEAAKQCGRGILPVVENPITFKEAIARLKNTELALMPYEMLANDNSKSLKVALSNSTALQIGVIIGPEGGFSDSEAELAKKEGLTLVSLGRRILRTETVSSVILSTIMYEKDEM